jgi:hypothetical protein
VNAFSPRYTASAALLAALALPLLAQPASAPRLLPAVEVEDAVYTFEPANNGSGPLWGNASSCIVRLGQEVFASGLETLKDVQPLNNVRWLLFQRGAKGWELRQADPKGRTREPCPLGCFPDGRLLLSVNPTLTDLDARNGAAEPQILEFRAARPKARYKTLLPAWEGTPPFTEHSYRSFAVDGPNREFILLQNIGYDHAEWSFYDRAGAWSAQGKLTWPWGAEYEKPEPVRLCYPALALRDRAVYFLGVSDIIEPNSAWREAKKAITGQNWDYDFRRLFFAWCPDITTGKFSDWIEVASREKTCGWIMPCDVWVAPDGAVHLLWRERALDERLREKFFPTEKQSHTLEYAVVRDGKVSARQTLVRSAEDAPGEVVGAARFHVVPDQRLFVFYYANGIDATGKPFAGNRVMEILADGKHGEAVAVPLEYPFTNFITASWRGGSAPSALLDVLGTTNDRPGMCYARINLLNPILADFEVSIEKTAAGSRLRCAGSRSLSGVGKVVSWKWDLDGTHLEGETVAREFDHGGSVRVTLTVKDDQGNRQTVARHVSLPLTPGDVGLPQWGLIVRTEAEGFVGEGGGTIHVRNDKLGAAGLSLSHWNSAGHWLEWEVDVPRDDEYFLFIRYATPEVATRHLSIDGLPRPALRFPSTRGYGSDTIDNWGMAVWRTAKDRPVALRLTQGKHRLRLENSDGTGLNLDGFDWVAKTPPPAAEATAAAPAGFEAVTDPDGFRYLLPLHGTLNPGRLQAEIGHCFTVLLGPRYPGDGVKDGPASTLQLFEDGKALGPAHVAHAEIRTEGKGRFSHWGNAVFLSTSDNSDPRQNGRTYSWQIAPR